MNATVTVTYANDRSKSAEVGVEIGKLPVTLMDFEPSTASARPARTTTGANPLTWITA